MVEESLVRSGLPYRVFGGVKFYDRHEIKDALAYLRVLVNPDDEVSWKRIVNTPRRGVGDTSVAKIERMRRPESRSPTRSPTRPRPCTGKALGGCKDLLELIDAIDAAAEGGVAARSKPCCRAAATSRSSKQSAIEARAGREPAGAGRSAREFDEQVDRGEFGGGRDRRRRHGTTPRTRRPARVQAFLEASRSSPTSTPMIPKRAR